MKLYNTLVGRKEVFTPSSSGKVKLYTCGPTVYDYLHVGNWAAYIYWDILVRTLQVNDYSVDRVMNITDVGHLVSDADEGEDKLEKGARREGKTAWDIAAFYTKDFLLGMKQLNLIAPEHLVRATDYINEQLELIRTLKEKGYTYQISDGIYFDTSKFSGYADFANLDTAGQQAGARIGLNAQKRNPSDFALWKFSPINTKRDMEWPTPVDILDEEASLDATDQEEDASLRSGPVMGFPGWHLECSAMAMTILGPTLDIHTGGIDHIPVHHTNEVAQSEAATGKKFANYWLHANHLKVNGTKISKSLGNGYTLQDIKQAGYEPLDLRMAVVQGHYRKEGNFSLESLAAARSRRHSWQSVAALRHQVYASRLDSTQQVDSQLSKQMINAQQQLIDSLSNDLNSPEALLGVDQIFSSLEAAKLLSIDRGALQQLLDSVDKLLGINIIDSTPDITDQQKQILLERQQLRDKGDWSGSDRLRDQLSEQGVAIRDTAHGQVWYYSQPR